MKLVILIFTLASSLSGFDIFSSTNAKRIQGKNVGSLSLCADGDALTWVTANARFECVAGSGGGAPTNAQYLTLTTNATLSAERVLTMDSNMTATDGGAGGAYTIGPDTAKMESRATQQAGTSRRCADSGGDDTYTCTMTPTLTAYNDGMVVEFEATVTANTGAATLEIDSLGSGTGKAIKLCDGSTDPASGDIAVGKQVALRYDGTVFRLPCNPATLTGVTTALTYRTCSITIGADNGSALTDADLGPQGRICFIPQASTITEVTVASDAGTPSVQIRKNVAGTTTNLLSAALAAVGGGGASTIACAKSSTSATCLDGTTSSGSITVSTTSLAQGSWIELTSGTAGGTAKRMSVAVTYTVN